MYLDELFGSAVGAKLNAKRYHMASCTYTAYYQFWRENLFERAMRLFVWDTGDTVPPHEIEMRLILEGFCAITKSKTSKDLLAMFTSLHGVTEYTDIKSKGYVRCPKWTKEVTFGKDAVLICNDSLKTAVFPLIHHYATLLAHAECSFVGSLVGARDLGGAPVVHDESQKESVLEYQAKRFNGEWGVMRDASMLGIEYLNAESASGTHIGELWETRNKILNSFYADLGIKTALEKRSNTIVEEVEADTSMLLLNISDMLKWREKACEEVNAMYGTSWSVKLSPEIEAERKEDARDEKEDDSAEPVEAGESERD